MSKKEIRYLNKDFQTFREQLINFAKIYYPNTYKNFNESSVGMMFIELSSYIGDVLSYYIDNSLKESLLLYAEENENIYAIAQSLGYKPSISVPSIVDLDVYQILPAIGSGVNTVPDYKYALTLNSGMKIQSETDSTIIFRTLEDVNFTVSSSANPTDVVVYETDNNGNITFFLIKKTTLASAGEIKEVDFTFTDPKKFETKIIADDNIIEILDATDSDGNTWYHVPFLAQDTVFTEIKNTSENDKTLSQYNSTVPYLLKLKKVARRFTSRIRSDKKVELQFGSGVSDDPDELLIPNPTNIGSNIFGSVSFSNNPIDPSNFLYTKTYGQSPQNTIITVKYVSGGGLKSNVNSNDLTKITDVSYSIENETLNPEVLEKIKNSVATNNPVAATGGKNGESPEEIRHNALSNFPSQLRAVTREDYIARIYSLPPRYGRVSKAYVIPDDQLSGYGSDRIPNPLAINLYVLGYDTNGRLTNLNQATKENIKTYMSQYRLLTDSINIKNAFIINITVKFTIIAFKNKNKREVLLKCVEKLKNFFNIEKWQINQPIILADIQSELFSVEGVQSVTKIEIENNYSTDQGYSGNVYDIKSATRDGIIYPSIDPSIFEIKYLNKDIQGNAL